jgi:hypothetical protein
MLVLRVGPLIGIVLVGCTCTHPREKKGVEPTTPLPSAQVSTPEKRRLFRVQYGAVVLQRGLGSVKLTGDPKVVFRRGDSDGSFLARSAVDGKTLAPPLARLKGTLVTVAETQSAQCSARIGEIEAYAWAMPSQPRKAAAWDKVDDRHLAEGVFSDGELLLVGDLDSSGECDMARISWAAPAGSRLRVEPARDTNPDSLPLAVRSQANSDYSREWQREFEHFKQGEQTRRQGTNALPENWTDLASKIRTWSFGSGVLSDTVVVQFHRAVTPEQVGRFRQPDRPWFQRSSLAVWKLHSDAGGPEFLGPERSVLGTACAGNRQCEYLYGSFVECDSVEAVYLDAQPPVLTFHTGSFEGVLSLGAGKYLLDEELTMGPKL